MLAALSLTACLVATIRVAATASAKSARVELSPCDAQGNPLPGQSYYKIHARAGRTAREYALVGNAGDRAGRVSVVPVDATSALYGGVAYRLPGQPRRHVGAWTRVSRSKIWLRPGETVVVSFTVHLPKHLKPGQYVGGLTAFVPARHRKSAKLAVLRLQLRVVTAILVRVPGPTRSRFTISHVSVLHQPTGIFAGVRIRNSGSRLLKGHGKLIVRKVGEHAAGIRKPFFVDTMVPHTAITYPIPWKPKPKRGEYKARVRLTWKAGAAGWHHRLWVGPRRHRAPLRLDLFSKRRVSAFSLSLADLAGLVCVTAGGVMAGMMFWRHRPIYKADEL